MMKMCSDKMHLCELNFDQRWELMSSRVSKCHDMHA